MAKQKYYVVWKGRRKGVYNSWEACSAQVSGFAGAQYKAFDSLQAAESAYHSAYNDYVGKTTVTKDGVYTTLPTSTLGKWKTARVKPLLPSICVDAACAGVPGPVEWRGVETESGKELFKVGPYPDGTNNIGEFLAIVRGLIWLNEKNISWPLYSDSHNAILWVNLKKCRTKMDHTQQNAPLFTLISAAEGWLAENNFLNPVLKWETEDWGENPADFGRK